MAKDAYAGKNSTDKSVEELPVIDESLVKINLAKMQIKFLVKNMVMISFHQHQLLLQRLETLPLPNDYKIS